MVRLFHFLGFKDKRLERAYVSYRAPTLRTIDVGFFWSGLFIFTNFHLRSSSHPMLASFLTAHVGVFTVHAFLLYGISRKSYVRYRDSILIFCRIYHTTIAAFELPVYLASSDCPFQGVVKHYMVGNAVMPLTHWAIGMPLLFRHHAILQLLQVLTLGVRTNAAVCADIVATPSHAAAISSIWHSIDLGQRGVGGSQYLGLRPMQQSDIAAGLVAAAPPCPQEAEGGTTTVWPIAVGTSINTDAATASEAGAAAAAAGAAAGAGASVTMGEPDAAGCDKKATASCTASLPLDMAAAAATVNAVASGTGSEPHHSTGSTHNAHSAAGTMSRARLGRAGQPLVQCVSLQFMLQLVVAYSLTTAIWFVSESNSRYHFLLSHQASHQGRHGARQGVAEEQVSSEPAQLAQVARAEFQEWMGWSAGGRSLWLHLPASLLLVLMVCSSVWEVLGLVVPAYL